MSSVTTAFNVLFDILSAYKARVWDLDIAAAIRGLLNQIRTGGYIDFERSGVAILSSAIIFRRKTEELLKLEEPPKPSEDKGEPVVYDRLVLPINLPVRTAHPVVDSTELFSDLVELLTRALRERKLFVGSTEVAEDLIVPDLFLEDVENRVRALGDRIASATRNTGRVDVLELFTGLDYIETVRTFIILLFVLSSMDYEIEKKGEQFWIVSTNQPARA
ncbi:MAG TPA: hypothetical protein VEG31_01600 [Thermoproteota archaeon]|nr:hypothetical protein [Thermoproteota archaeon]